MEFSFRTPKMTLLLGRASAVLEHSSDALTIDIQLCPLYKHFLCTSLTSLALFLAEDNNRQLISKLYLTEEQLKQYGMLRQAVWLNSTTFSVLTSEGFILIFSIPEQNAKLTVQKVVKSPEGCRFTTIATFLQFIIGGTDSGLIIVTTADSPVSITHKLIDSPIKKLCINGHNGLILSAESDAYTFKLNRHILVDINFDFAIKKIDLTYATTIAISHKNNFGSAIGPTGALYITNFNESESRLKIKGGICNVQFWTDDGNYIISIFPDGFVIIASPMYKTCKSFKHEDLAGCLTAAMGRNHIFASTQKGLVNIPIFSVLRSSVPIIISPTAFCLYRGDDNSIAIPIYVKVPNHIITHIKQIEYVAPSPDEKMVAFSGRGTFYLYDIQKDKWINPNLSNLNVRGMVYQKNILHVLNFDPGTFQYSLFSYNETKVVFKLPLKSRPLGIQADDRFLVLSFNDHILVYEGKFLRSTINLPSPPVLAMPHSKSGQVFVLLRNKQLYNVIVKTSEFKLAAEDVSDFIVSYSGDGMIFIVTGLRIRIASPSKMKFGPFIETSEIIIGAFRHIPSLLTIPSSAKLPTNPKVSQFFDLSVVAALDNPDRAADMVRPLKDSPNFFVLIRQISVFALRERRGASLAKFLRHFPDQMNEALASALRAVESPERRGVIEEMGLVSKIFCDFAGIKSIQHPSGVVDLFSIQQKTEQEIGVAALLLPVIMEEEGPTVGFPAAIFVLSKLHTNLSYVGSLARFLDPLISEGVETPDGRINCVGMSLAKKEYTELCQRLTRQLDSCVVDLMYRVEPSLCLQFADAFRLDLSAIFGRYPLSDAPKLIELLDSLAPLLMEGSLTQGECSRLAELALAGNWHTWAAGLLLTGGEQRRAADLISKKPKLLAQLQGSQWQHLLFS